MRFGGAVLILFAACIPAAPTPSVPSVARAERVSVSPVRSIDLADANFADLAPVGRAIGDARIVMLGEAGHGDGSTFRAKARMVRFLHEKMGFDILAWESGVWECEQMNVAFASSAAIADVARIGVYSLWANSEQVLPIFSYARESLATARPLQMAGIDPKFSTTARAAYRRWLLERLDATTLVKPEERADLERAFSRFPNVGKMQKLSREEREEDRAAFRRVLERAEKSEDLLAGIVLTDRSLLRRSLRNVIALYEWHEAVRADISTTVQWDDHVSLNNVRDRTMAENLVWVANERFPGAKVIVWAANMHVARDMSTVDGTGTRFNPHLYDGFRPMGDLAEHWFPKAVYRLAFTSFDGETGLTGQPASTVDEVPRAGSVEASMQAFGYPQAFVDFRASTDERGGALRGRRPGAFLGHVLFEADWARVFDGVFFIRTMSPSTPRAATAVK